MTNKPRTSRPERHAYRNEPASYNAIAAANIKNLRIQSGLSRDKLVGLLAKKGISMHVNSLRRIEEGEQPLKLQEAMVFSEIFDVDFFKFCCFPVDEEQGRLKLHSDGGDELVVDISFTLEDLLERIYGGQDLLSELAVGFGATASYHHLEERIEVWKTFIIECYSLLKRLDLAGVQLDDDVARFKKEREHNGTR